MNKKVPFLYKFGKFLLTPIFKFYDNPKIIGKENIQKESSIIITIHFMEQHFSTIISTKRGIHNMAKKEYFDSKKTKCF